MFGVMIRVMVLNITFNNMAVISWRLVILVEENGVSGENQVQVCANHEMLWTKDF
jgi:hypothetical protein